MSKKKNGNYEYLEKFMNDPKTLYDELGGENRLREIINDFVNKMFEDIMIGFFFYGISKKRIQELEFQFISKLLGADISYTGRPVDVAHKKHPITSGHFNRRKQILKDTMSDHNVSKHIQDIILTHTEYLRNKIVSKEHTICI